MREASERMGLVVLERLVNHFILFDTQGNKAIHRAPELGFCERSDIGITPQAILLFICASRAAVFVDKVVKPFIPYLLRGMEGGTSVNSPTVNHQGRLIDISCGKWSGRKVPYVRTGMFQADRLLRGFTDDSEGIAGWWAFSGSPRAFKDGILFENIQRVAFRLRLQPSGPKEHLTNLDPRQ
ncbi:hypothetical protein BD779DRAFT_1143355 [Infundibulicybe gibba]|nr:hypothetical protein BD779DRAFT_1143355 [Infundibulicybe gibba]